MSRCTLYDISFGYGGSWRGEMFCTYSYHHHRHHPLPHHSSSHQHQQSNYLPRFYSREMTTTATDDSCCSSISPKPSHRKSWLPLNISKVSFGETSSLATTALPRNGNNKRDSSCRSGSIHDNARYHGSRAKKNDQVIRCSPPQTDEFPRAVSRENVRHDSYLEGSQDKMIAESVVTTVGQRKPFPSTRFLRLIPTNRPSLLPNAKRHRTLTTTQQTVKPQGGYVDPVINCSAEFQQRLTELTALQFETVRWEGLRKTRNNPTARHDSHTLLAPL